MNIILLIFNGQVNEQCVTLIHVSNKEALIYIRHIIKSSTLKKSETSKEDLR